MCQRTNAFASLVHKHAHANIRLCIHNFPTSSATFHHHLSLHPVSWWFLQHHISGDSARRKNLFWFQWFSSGDPSIPQNHRLHSASKFVAGTVTYIFLREHYGTLASLNFYPQVVLPADSLPICRTADCGSLLEDSRCLVTLLEYIQLGSTRYPVTVAKWKFIVIM